MTYEELLDKWIRKLGRDCTAGEIVHDLRQLEQPVRCKDCIHRMDNEMCEYKIFLVVAQDDNDFCSWGERREDEAD